MSVTFPVAGSRLPTKLPPWTVNQRMPRASKIGVRIRARASGILCSVTRPVFGSSLPMRPHGVARMQMWPAVSRRLPGRAVPSWKSGADTPLKAPVAGSSRPRALARCAMYATYGAIGRDLRVVRITVACSGSATLWNVTSTASGAATKAASATRAALAHPRAMVRPRRGRALRMAILL